MENIIVAWFVFSGKVLCPGGGATSLHYMEVIKKQSWRMVRGQGEASREGELSSGADLFMPCLM